MSADKPTIHGLYVDLVAPCAADGRLLKREYHVHLRRMARVADVQGVIVNGPAGEAGSLDRDARMNIVKVAVSASPAQFPLLAAIPADIVGIADEAHAAIAAGATGIVVLGNGSAEDDATALRLTLETVRDVPVVAWGIAPAVAAAVAGLAAVVLDKPDQTADGGELPVMLTDQSFDLKAITAGIAIGAVLASANVAEAHWGKIFRHAADAPGVAELILTERVGGFQDALIAIENSGDGDSRRVAAAIKHALFTITQNSSAATFSPLLDIGDEARATIANALVTGRLMPGMV